MLIVALIVTRIWAGLLADPTLATRLGAAFAGHPEFAAELVEICRRESPGNMCARTVGLHPNNRISDIRIAYAKAISLKYLYLHPGCAEHVVDTNNDAEVLRFGVRGSHGLMAAYSVRYLGPCVAPEALDHPFTSAVAATRRAEAMCSRSRACSKSSRHALWIGVRLESARLASRSRARDRQELADVAGSGP